MIAIALILVFLAGLCNGIMDAIAWHNSYEYFGHWWSLESWKDKKFLGMFVLNAWHTFKFLMIGSLLAAILCGFYSDYIFESYQMLIFQILSLILIFVISFRITYK